mmetsp:Transcript_24762/g.62152  ORF Transcript_24762/g.62152 Transcript_24762/m.62152 type:complete len:215 (+) Transcript_24762:659-1303(+)
MPSRLAVRWWPLPLPLQNSPLHLPPSIPPPTAHSRVCNAVVQPLGLQHDVFGCLGLGQECREVESLSVLQLELKPRGVNKPHPIRLLDLHNVGQGYQQHVAFALQPRLIRQVVQRHIQPAIDVGVHARVACHNDLRGWEAEVLLQLAAHGLAFKRLRRGCFLVAAQQHGVVVARFLLQLRHRALQLLDVPCHLVPFRMPLFLLPRICGAQRDDL